MNILFICHANVGRSQAAMELYRKNGGQADSAGTKVDAPKHCHSGSEITTELFTGRFKTQKGKIYQRRVKS